MLTNTIYTISGDTAFLHQTLLLMHRALHVRIISDSVVAMNSVLTEELLTLPMRSFHSLHRGQVCLSVIMSHRLMNFCITVHATDDYARRLTGSSSLHVFSVPSCHLSTFQLTIYDIAQTELLVTTKK
jgi:hypothetical protein